MYSFEKLKPFGTRLDFIDTIWDRLYDHDVKDHLPKSKVIRGQVVEYDQNVEFTLFEKPENVKFDPFAYLRTN